MPFESLSERFQAAFKKLRGKGKLSEEDVSEALKDELDHEGFDSAIIKAMKACLK